MRGPCLTCRACQVLFPRRFSRLSGAVLSTWSLQHKNEWFIMHAYRTHTCGALRKAQVGETARLSGWIHRKRDHGGLLFVDLRDHYGLTQCVLEPDNPHFAALEHMRVESVVTVTGAVVARTEDTINANLPTGEVELRVEEMSVQS